MQAFVNLKSSFKKQYSKIVYGVLGLSLISFLGLILSKSTGYQVFFVMGIVLSSLVILASFFFSIFLIFRGVFVGEIGVIKLLLSALIVIASVLSSHIEAIAYHLSYFDPKNVGEIMDSLKYFPDFLAEAIGRSLFLAPFQMFAFTISKEKRNASTHLNILVGWTLFILIFNLYKLYL
ncbi:hypothetical protein [Cobetia amphilecti]|uniref:hypothetical protein n=1 Tax=Cobetia amphilecti TaxID=1055104 RepID=UPI0026E20142|nr:hypothetical protein [Cobetia amphilecti]MDO6814764.1 hypothetical protein [Cobetia amphilecti]